MTAVAAAPDVAVQQSLETSMLELGAERYRKQQAKATERQELTSAQSRLFKSAVGKVEAAISLALQESAAKRGRKPVWFMPAEAIGALQCAVIVLRLAFDAATQRRSYTDMCVSVGKQIEIELVSRIVQAQDKGLYKRMVERVKRLKSPNARIAEFTEIACGEGMWAPLDQADRQLIGSGLFNFVLAHTELFHTYLNLEGTDGQTLEVAFTDEAAAQLDRIEGAEVWMKPVYRAMVTPPRPWESVRTGCYHDAKLASTVPLIKTGNRDALKLVDAAVKSNAPFVQAVNAIQAVPLRINTWVLEVIEGAAARGIQCDQFPQPLVTIADDLSSGAKAQLRQLNTEIKAYGMNFRRDLEEAKEYAGHEHFYLPAQLDWRGRVYAKSHLNHQREDYCKGLFLFANGERLDAGGAVWLAIHLATTGGFNKIDKAPFEQRYQWTKDNEHRIISTVANPYSDLWWLEADSPFCFLAAAHAWAQYQADPIGYVCHLPVAVDGSCSGLQHFSAMLRDPVGGSHVNLVPNDKPQDVYAAVAEVVLRQAQQDDCDEARQWLSFGINRNVAKRCVMTYVYGSKQYGFAEHLYDDFMVPFKRLVQEKKLAQHPFGDDYGRSAAQYMGKLVWAAVQEVVKAAAEGMDWLQKVAALLAAEGLPVVWTTPMGLPVLNAYYKPNVQQVEVFLWDKTLAVPVRFRPRVNLGATDELLKRKQRSSISPNFVHALDSAHLMSVVVKAKAEGIHDFLMVHDSFGCLPSRMQRFSEIVREAFVELYEHHDPLMSLYEATYLQLSEKGRKKLKPPPAKGTLNLGDVLNSLYAFA